MDIGGNGSARTSAAAAGIHGIVAGPAAHGAPANMPSEAVMRIGSVLLLIWLVIGANVGGQRPLLQRF
jgi:hypothetical protein